MNITDAVLASTLKELIAAQIVQRQSYDEIPPKVEYRLTNKGQSVVPICKVFANGLAHTTERTANLFFRNAKNAITILSRAIEWRNLM